MAPPNTLKIQTIDLRRYKKSFTGVLQFAIFIEQAPPSLRSEIIAFAQQSDPAFLDEVMRRVVYFEEIGHLDRQILAEILSQVPLKTLAYALRGTDEDFRKIVLEQIGFQAIRLLSDEEDKIPADADRGLTVGARKAILKTARKLEAADKFSFQLEECPRLSKKK